MQFINGEWVEGLGETFISKNPATQGEIWSGIEATQTEIQQAVHAAGKAFSTWSALPHERRVEALERFEKKVRAKEEELAELIAKEVGKPLWEAKLEVAGIIGKVATSRAAYEERCGVKTRELEGATLTTHQKPHGIVAVLGPFNFPGHLPMGHIIPALLAGNTVVFKPSEKTPAVGEALVNCWELPPGVLNLVQGGHIVGQALATHSHVDGVFFTGSPPIGAKIAEHLAKTPHKILALEMGGNNPLVVTDPSDFEAAAYVTIQSAFLTSGQRCSCARRLIVLEGHEGNEFLKVLTHMVESIQIGSYTDRPEPFMGPLISMEMKTHLLNTQASLSSLGGKSLVEMADLKESLPFVSPGMMDVTTIPNRADEELFGPFLQVIRVPTFEAAIEEANRTQYGLTAALISRDREQFETFFRCVRAGVINWNRPTTGASGWAPFGGIGKSGNHRPSGYYAADYCAYPIASMETPAVHLPKEPFPGITLLART